MDTKNSQWIKYSGKSKKPAYIVWFMTNGCNFKCSYCFYKSHNANDPLYSKKSMALNPFAAPYIMSRIKSGKNFKHAFLNFSVDEWLKAFNRLNERDTIVKITGGEPFLDAKNFKPFLEGLTSMIHINNIRIDTNASFSPDIYDFPGMEKVGLNISFHPNSINLDKFSEKISRIKDAGIKISMVNYVLCPSQLDMFEAVQERMQKLDIFTNANIYVETSEKQTEEGFRMYRKYNPEIDVKLKTGSIKTIGKLCGFPAFGYQMNPTGIINAGCYPNLVGDFINKGLPGTFKKAAPCTRPRCGCLDQYAFLKSVPQRGNSYDLMGEYVEDVKKSLE